MTSAPNYNGLNLIISEAKEHGHYDFTVRNDGDMTLWHLEFPTYDLLGPGDFGLDDTHMPASLTDEPVALIERLKPKESVTLRREKWGTLERYRGKASGSYLATFSPQEDGSVRYGLRAFFMVQKSDGTALVAPSPQPEPKPANYRRGYTAGLWLKQTLAKIKKTITG